MHHRLVLSRVHPSVLCKHVLRLSTNIVKPYPSFVERQLEVSINTASGDEFVEIDRESKVKLAKPGTYVRPIVNYVDTNPLGDKNQPIVLLVHGYPGSHEVTRNFIEEFQRRNYRCIAPDMPFCGKTKMPLWSALVWKNSVYMRARFLGELMKSIMGDKLARIDTVVGFHENAYALMSMIDQYEYFRCRSLVAVDPVPRRLIRFFPLAKLAFDFGRLPLHWPVARFLLKTFGYKELLNFSQQDIMGALRTWMIEDKYTYDGYIHNLWLSRLRTMVVVSDEDKFLDRNLLDALIKDLAVEPFNKSNMPGAVIKKYACSHAELLTDRISYVADDIETFISSVLKSPAATTTQTFSSARTKEKEERKFAQTAKGDQAQPDAELDVDAYRRAAANDFFSKAFGPSESQLKPSQPHSVRSTFEQIAGGFVQRQPAGTQRQTLESVKEEMRKKKVRIETKN